MASKPEWDHDLDFVESSLGRIADSLEGDAKRIREFVTAVRKDRHCIAANVFADLNAGVWTTILNYPGQHIALPEERPRDENPELNNATVRQLYMAELLSEFTSEAVDVLDRIQTIADERGVGNDDPRFVSDNWTSIYEHVFGEKP